MRLGVVGNRAYSGLPDVLSFLVSQAPALGYELYLENDLREIAGSGKRLTEPTQLDGLITIGGDGTMLRGSRFLDGHQVPILGVNSGRLGFLTSCNTDELEEVLPLFTSGEYRAEVRMRLDGSVIGSDGRERQRWSALNDIVLHKGGFARVVHLRVSANGELIAAYAADGLCIATPTGSTAYNLSAGGPVVVPTVESILLAPISAHALAIRPVVLPPTTAVEVRADDGPEELMVTVDGQVGTNFASGETLVVNRSGLPALLVRFPGATFFTRMRRKLGWGGLSDRDPAEGC